MAGFVSPPPVWTDVSSDEYQLWFTQVMRIVNQNATTSAGTGLAGLSLDTGTGEITEGNTLYGYFRRYLHVRFASDANGATQITDASAFTGSTIYIGTFNTETTDLPDNANFVYRPFDFPNNGQISYILEGGRRIQFFTSADAPAGAFAQNTPTTIDLDDIAGEDGATPVAYYSQNALNDRPTQDPAQNPAIWDRENIAAANPTRDYNWIIWGFDRGAAARSRYTLSATGTTGTVTTNPGSAESGTVVVDSSAAVTQGTGGTVESFVLTVTGNTGTSTSPGTFSFPGTINTGTVITFDIDLTQGVFINTNVFGLSVQNANFEYEWTGIFGSRFTGTTDAAAMVTALDFRNYRNSIIEGTSRNRATDAITTNIGSLTITDYSAVSTNILRMTFTFSSFSSAITVTEFGDSSQGNPLLLGGRHPASALTFRASPGTQSSQIRFQVPADSIDETLTLAPNLSTQQAIADDIVTRFNANINLQAYFTAATRNAMNQVVFTTDAVGDITAMISAIDQSGDITVNVTATDGTGATGFIAPVIRVNFDSTRDNPTTTSITLAALDSASDIATDIQTAINNHSQYTAVIDGTNNRQVNYNKNAVGISDDLTIEVVTQGSSNLASALITVSVTTQGVNTGTTGSIGTYTITAGTEMYSGNLDNQTAVQVIDTIRTQINSGSTFTGIETTPTFLTIDADAAGATELTININPGSGNLRALFNQIRVGTLGGFEAISSINQFQGREGAQGAQGVFRIDAFRRGTTAPPEPTGGTRTTPPTGWSYTITSGTGALYQSFVLFDPINDTITTNFGTRWSPVFQAGSQGPAGTNGTDGTDGVGSNTRLIFHNNARTLTPTLPSANNLIDNSWSETPATNSNWFAEQVNTTNAAGTTVTTYGSWRGPILITGQDGTNPTVTDNGDGTFTVTDGDGNTVTIRDGAQGVTGPSGNTLDIVFQRSTTVPVTPSPSTGVPTGWFATVEQVPAGSGLIYGSFGTQVGGVGNFTWEAPVQLEGTEGSSGSSVFQAIIYQRATATPTTPTGGSYNFTNNTLTTPSGWSSSVPSGAGQVYSSTTIFAIEGTEGTDSATTWTTPTEFTRNGNDGAAGMDGTNGENGSFTQIRFSPLTDQPGISTYPVNNIGTTPGVWTIDSTNAEWTISREVTFDSNNLRTNGAWTVARFRGDTGAAGMDGAQGPIGISGSFTQVRFADDATQPQPSTYPTNDLGTNTTWTSSSANAVFVITREVSFSATNVRTNGDWSISRFAGTNGMDGNPGLNGSDGAPGAAGAGLFVASVTTTVQNVLDSLNNTQLTNLLVGVAGRQPVQGDILVIRSSNNALISRIVRYNGTTWDAQASFIDGNLIVNGTITTDEIAANTITAGDIASNTITAAEIAANTITGDRIAANTIEASRLNVNELSAINANLGIVTAGTIRGNSIEGNTIQSSNFAITFNEGPDTISRTYYENSAFFNIRTNPWRIISSIAPATNAWADIVGDQLLIGPDTPAGSDSTGFDYDNLDNIDLEYIVIADSATNPTNRAVFAVAGVNVNRSTIVSGRISNASITLGALQESTGVNFTFGQTSNSSLSVFIRRATRTITGYQLRPDGSADLGGLLSADNITTGTLSADRLEIDGATIDTNDQGQLVVQTVSGGGILTTPSGIEVATDGTTVVVRDGMLTTVDTPTVINTVRFTGGQAARTYTGNLNPVTGSTQTGFRSNTGVFFWRYDMNEIGAAQYGALTGITLSNFDMNVTITNNAGDGFDEGATVDLTCFTGSGTTTGFGDEITFDGRIAFPLINNGSSLTRSGTFSTIGGQFTPPPGGNRFLFLGFRINVPIGAFSFFGNTAGASYSVTRPAQSDTLLTIHFENGTSITRTFNSFFV